MAIGCERNLARIIRGMAAVLCVLLALSPAGFAASSREAVTRQNLLDAEQRRKTQLSIGEQAAERAERAAAMAAGLAAERVAAAARLQQADAATQQVATRIDELATQRREADRRLRRQALAMQPLLPLMQRLSLYPVETLLAVPASPEATLRGLIVLKGLSRQMQIEAAALRRDQADLGAANLALEAEMPRLAEARAAQEHAGALLDRQIAAAHAEQAKAEADAGQAVAQAAAAAARMDSLRAVLSVLESQERTEAARARDEALRNERQKRPPDVPPARQREATLVRPPGSATFRGGATPGGQLQPPVIGVLVKSWGEATDGGPATGVSFHAPPAARVVAPCGGRVVFADTFRSYGLLLIVDCGGGYHVVMAGFERLNVKLGQSVVAAEPVGTMPNWVPGSEAQRPALYVELRHDGQPINPAPWLKSNG